MLKLDGLVAAYDDVTCLHGVSLEVRRGEIVDEEELVRLLENRASALTSSPSGPKYGGR